MADAIAGYNNVAAVVVDNLKYVAITADKDTDVYLYELDADNNVLRMQRKALPITKYHGHLNMRFELDGDDVKLVIPPATLSTSESACGHGMSTGFVMKVF